MKATLGPGGRGRPLRARIAIAATLVVAAVAMATGVAAGSGPAAHRGSAADPVKLTFMSNAQSAGIESAWAELIAAYEKANPNVKITRVPVAFANYKTTAKLRASSSSAPDLIEGDSSPGGILASLATPGLLLPVDKYAAKYNWKKTFGPLHPPALSVQGRDEGRLRQHLRSAGLRGDPRRLRQQVDPHQAGPQTAADVRRVRDKPAEGQERKRHATDDRRSRQVALGSRLRPARRPFRKPVGADRLVQRAPRSDHRLAGTTKAATVLQQWVKNGYFEDGANGVSDGDAVARFGKGLSLYKIDGPWETEVNTKALGKNVGFFLLPAAKAGVTPPSTGSMGWDVAITAKSKNPDAAATFLNFLTTNTARAIIMKHQNPPGAPGPAIGLGSNPVLSTIVESYAHVLANGNLVPYLDTGYPQAAPHDMLANVQSMAAGKMSPADFLKSSQAGWAAFHNSK